ncbi:Outer spore coat protein E (CotE) [compost metagenome]
MIRVEREFTVELIAETKVVVRVYDTADEEDKDYEFLSDEGELEDLDFELLDDEL